MSDYEKLRRKNIEDNKRILAELGLANIFPKASKVTFKKKKPLVPATTSKPKPTQKRKLEIEEEELGSIRKRRRRSARIQGKEADAAELEDEESGDEEDEEAKPTTKVFRPNTYGAIEGVDVGTTWMMRIECSRDGIHRPTVAGIHGGPEGAYSIALSGGYDDNIDLGEGFTYTGEGGRDLKGTKANPKNLRTAPQSKDQTLTRGNLALSKNVETKYPVRVIRGYKLDSPFAPEDGYRYDGLYSVEKSWFTTGLSGFGVWKFALKRCPDQAPPPWTLNESTSGDESTDNETSKSKANTNKEENMDTVNPTDQAVSDEEEVEDSDSVKGTATISTDQAEITGELSSNDAEKIVKESENDGEDSKVLKSTDDTNCVEENPSSNDVENPVPSEKEEVESNSSKDKTSANKENEIQTKEEQKMVKTDPETESKVAALGRKGVLTENESKESEENPER